jgi:type II secretory pathway pseudopilin PulG
VPRARRPPGRSGSRGFSLFEVVVVVCLIVLLYLIAQQRLNEMPAAAERASFYGVLAQLKTGMNLAMLAAVSRGGLQQARGMEGANPMDLLLETPGNYRGELDVLQNPGNLRRASWYFERSSRNLVYLVGSASIEDVQVTVGGMSLNPGEVRFRVASAYGAENERALLASESGERGGQASGWQGLLLVPVYAFEWERRAGQPVDL